jgi:hypothetical protein
MSEDAENRTERLSLRIRPSLKEAIADAEQNARENPDLPNRTQWQSVIVRNLIEAGLEATDGRLDEILPDEMLDIWRREQEHDRVRAEAKKAEMIGGWRGRVRERIENRLAGPEPYPPEQMEMLIDKYIREIEIWCDDPEQVENHRNWIYDEYERYVDAYHEKQYTPRETYMESDDRVALGADLRQLKRTWPELADRLSDMIQMAGGDADAKIDALANETGVEAESVRVLLDQLTDETTRPEDAVNSFSGYLPPSQIETLGLDEPEAVRALQPLDERVEDSAAQGGETDD